MQQRTFWKRPIVVVGSLVLLVLFTGGWYARDHWLPLLVKPAPMPLGPILHFNVNDTEIGQIAVHPEGQKLLERYFPGVTKMDQFDVAMPMTLVELRRFRPDLVNEEGLSAIGPPLGELREVLNRGKSTKFTEIGVLLDDPVTRAILDKHIPGFSTMDKIDLARPFTLEFVKTYEPTIFTEERLAAINADLAALEHQP